MSNLFYQLISIACVLLILGLTSCAGRQHRFIKGCMTGMRVMHSAMTSTKWDQSWNPHIEKTCNIIKQTNIGVIVPGSEKI